MLKSALLAPLAGLVLGGVISAQQPDQDTMKANYEAKLSKEFISHGGWITDYDVARARSAKEGKPLFAYFSRSYAK